MTKKLYANTEAAIAKAAAQAAEKAMLKIGEDKAIVDQHRAYLEWKFPTPKPAPGPPVKHVGEAMEPYNNAKDHAVQSMQKYMAQARHLNGQAEQTYQNAHTTLKQAIDYHKAGWSPLLAEHYHTTAGRLFEEAQAKKGFPFPVRIACAPLMLKRRVNALI